MTNKEKLVTLFDTMLLRQRIYISLLSLFLFFYFIFISNIIVESSHIQCDYVYKSN